MKRTEKRIQNFNLRNLKGEKTCQMALKDDNIKTNFYKKKKKVVVKMLAEFFSIRTQTSRGGSCEKGNEPAVPQKVNNLSGSWATISFYF